MKQLISEKDKFKLVQTIVQMAEIKPEEWVSFANDNKPFLCELELPLPIQKATEEMYHMLSVQIKKAGEDFYSQADFERMFFSWLIFQGVGAVMSIEALGSIAGELEKHLKEEEKK